MSNDVKIRLAVEGGAQAVAAVDGVADHLRRVDPAARTAAQGADTMAAAVARMGSTIAGALGVGALAAMYMSTARAGIEMAKLSNTMAFASGTAQELGTNNAFLRNTVQALGLDLKSAGAAFASLTAAARGTRLEGEGARSVFDAVAKASTAMGLSADETKGSLLAIQQMISKGTVSAEELRGQLGERLPGAFQIAARAMGVTTQQLGKMLEQGQLATDVFLPRFAAQMRIEMGGAAARAADTVQANLNRLSTAWTDLQTTVTQSKFNNESLKGLAETVAAFSDVLKGSQVDATGWGSTVSGVMAMVGDVALSVGWAFKRLGLEIGGAMALAANYLQTEQEKSGFTIHSRAGVAGRADAEARGNARAKAIMDAMREDFAGKGAMRTDFTDALLARRAEAANIDPRTAARDALRQFDKDMRLLAEKPALGGGKGDGATEQAKATASYQDQLAAIQNKTAAMGEEADGSARLNEAEQARLKIYSEMGDKYRLWTAAQKTAVAQSLDEWSARIQLQDVTVAAAKAEADRLKTLDATLAQEDRELQGLRDKYIELTAGKKVLADIVIAREENNALMAEERVLSASSTGEYLRLQAIAVKLREQIALRKGIASATASNEATDANKHAADQALADWQRTSGQIGQSLADALMQGGKSAGEYLKGLFRTMVFRPIIQGTVQPFANSLLGTLGMGPPAGAGGAAGAGLGNMGGLASLGGLGAFGTFGTTFGMGAGMAGAGLGGTAFGAAGTLIGGGNYAAGLGMGAGAAASLAAGIAAGVYGGRAISGGRSLDGGSGNGVVNAGTAAGAYIGTVILPGLGTAIGAALGGVVGGLANRAFGRGTTELRARGIEGTLSGAGFAGGTFADYHRDGGWFNGDKNWTDKAAAPGNISRLIGGGADAVRNQAMQFGRALGLTTAALGDVSHKIRVQIGDDMAANQKAIADAMASYGAALVAGWAEALKPLSAYGETTAQTVERVAGALTGVNAVLKQLGQTALDATVAGAGTALALADTFGGLDTLTQTAARYYEAFYNDAERTAKLAGTVGEALATVGLALPATRAGFRALVDAAAADLGTAENRTRYATLMGVADAFAQITDNGQALIDAGQGVAAYIAELRGAASGSASLASARATYAADLAAARTGDVAATGRIVGEAKTLVDAVRAAASDPVALARETARIAAELQALPATRAWQGQLPLPAVGPGAPGSAPGSVGAAPAAAATAAATAATEAATNVAAALQAMLVKLAAFHEDNSAENGSIAQAVGKMARILDAVTPNGNAIAAEAAA